jgi:hypothetical protein
MIWLCAGTSMDDSRNEEPSHRYSVPPSRMRFRPWTRCLDPAHKKPGSKGLDSSGDRATVQESASDVLQASVPAL